MRTVTAKDLKTMLDTNQDLLLLNVLGEEDFEKEHIPGSHNIPESRDDFVTAIERLAGAKDKRIVVYCASKDCQASPKAATKLEQAGFTNVTDFEGGMAEWKLGNFEVESGSPATR